MLLARLLGGRGDHPFKGGEQKRGITKKHIPLIWENMLGTVMAREPKPDTEAKYFDYDYDAARKHARVDECTDLRICKTPRSRYYGYGYGPRIKQVALWGIPPEKK